MDRNAEENLKSFFEGYKQMVFKKGETIIRADDEPTGVFYVESGYVKMNSVFENGSELTMNIFKPGSFFPMVWAIGEVENTYYYQTMSNTTVYRAARKEVVDFVRGQPEILYDLTRRVLVGMDGMFTNIQHLLLGNSYKRVAAAVLICAKRFGQKKTGGGTVIELPLTHQDIANMAGLTRETTSIAMKKLKMSGLISRSGGKLAVGDVKKLEGEIWLNINNTEVPLLV